MPGIRANLPGARLAFSVFILAVLVPVGLMVYSALRGGESLVQTAADAIRVAATTGRAASTTVTLNSLDDLPPGFHPLNVTPPPSGYASLDAVAALPWAVTIAQAWANDARLERIDVERLHPDGLLNVADDEEAHVTYRFVSPNRMSDLRRRADLSANAEVQTEFWVRVQNGHPTVMAPTTPAALQTFRDHEGLPPVARRRTAARDHVRAPRESRRVPGAVLQRVPAPSRRRRMGLVFLDPVGHVTPARPQRGWEGVALQVVRSADHLALLPQLSLTISVPCRRISRGGRSGRITRSRRAATEAAPISRHGWRSVVSGTGNSDA